MSVLDNRGRIDPSLDRPVYKQLADLVRAQIEAGEFIPGQRLPAQKDYVQEHYLSRLTIHRAMEVLRKEGLIVTTRAGSRVRRPAERTVVPLGDGSVVACMPTEPERKKYGIDPGVPLVVVRRSEGVEVYPADRVVIRGAPGQGRSPTEQHERGEWGACVRAERGPETDGSSVAIPVPWFIAQRLGLSLVEAADWRNSGDPTRRQQGRSVAGPVE